MYDIMYLLRTWFLDVYMEDQSKIITKYKVYILEIPDIIVEFITLAKHNQFYMIMNEIY